MAEIARILNVSPNTLKRLSRKYPDLFPKKVGSDKWYIDYDRDAILSNVDKILAVFPNKQVGEITHSELARLLDINTETLRNYTRRWYPHLFPHKRRGNRIFYDKKFIDDNMAKIMRAIYE